jgi:hypothetical protein
MNHFLVRQRYLTPKQILQGMVLYASAQLKATFLLRNELPLLIVA